MTLRLSLALPIVGLMMLPANAETVWVGESFITSVTANCGTQWQVGDFGKAIFRPAIPGDSQNGSTSRLVFSGNETTIAHEVNGPFSGTQSYQATAVGPNGVVITFSVNSGALKNAAVVPAGFTAQTKTLRIRGSFGRFADIPGCRVLLEGVFVKQP